MWGESSKHCEINCQCSGLLPDNFRINSGNSATKRKQETASTYNFKTKMNPLTLDFNTPVSPVTPKRRILGEIQNNNSFKENLGLKDSLTSTFKLGDLQNKTSLKDNFTTFKPTSPYIERLKRSPDNYKYTQNTQKFESTLSEPFKTDSFGYSFSNTHSVMETYKYTQKQVECHSQIETHSKTESFQSFNYTETFKTQESFKYTESTQSHSKIDSPLSKLGQGSMIDSTDSKPQTPKQSPYHTPVYKPSPISSPLLNSPIVSHTPIITKTSKTKSSKSKINRIFEDRTKFKMDNKENEFMKFHFEEEARDCSFEGMQKKWTSAKLDFTDSIHKNPAYVPEKEDLDDLESLQDLEAEFESETFDTCTKYEIISTDSPNIISRGRNSNRKIHSKNFNFGAPISDCEQSTSFNRTNSENNNLTRPATRMLNFDDDDFEFTSPAAKKQVSVKKSLKFNETPTKLTHQRSDSSIGSMSISPCSSKLRIFTSESTTSMESGFISELDEQFLDIEESNSPKMANFNELLSGQIKENIFTSKNFLKRPTLARSLSYQIENKTKPLLSILENNEDKSLKRTERDEVDENSSKRRRSNCESSMERRPVLQRCFSENNASIMSALARSAVEPDLIGDFTQPFALPLTDGDHSDLKSISCETLADLLKGEYDDTIKNYQVIDCRYPYEFEGGHIVGAVNIYTTSQILSLINEPHENKRVLIFHCEFSIERGPKLSRFLRSSDRDKNKYNYPNLDYPEIYLLHSGYRGFYNKYPSLCTAGYIAMLDPKHKNALRKHRTGSNSRLLL